MGRKEGVLQFTVLFISLPLPKLLCLVLFSLLLHIRTIYKHKLSPLQHYCSLSLSTPCFSSHSFFFSTFLFLNCDAWCYSLFLHSLQTQTQALLLTISPLFPPPSLPPPLPPLLCPSSHCSFFPFSFQALMSNAILCFTTYFKRFSSQHHRFLLLSCYVPQFTVLLSLFIFLNCNVWCCSLLSLLAHKRAHYVFQAYSLTTTLLPPPPPAAPLLLRSSSLSSCFPAAVLTRLVFPVSSFLRLNCCLLPVTHIYLLPLPVRPSLSLCAS